MRRHSEPRRKRNEPLGRVILVPFDSVAIVDGELVSRNKMIAWGVFIFEGEHHLANEPED